MTILKTMSLDDKRSWLRKHGLIRGGGINGFNHQYIVWTPRHGNEANRYRGEGTDADTAHANLFKIVMLELYGMCLDE